MTVNPSDLSYLTYQQMFYKNATQSWFFVCSIKIDYFLYIKNCCFVMLSVNHPLISKISLLKRKSWYTYVNGIPFLPLYFFAGLSFWRVEFIGALIILGSVIVLHLLSFLLCIWSLRFRIMVRYSYVRTVLLFDAKVLNGEAADSVHVVAAPNCGSSSICELHHSSEKVRVRTVLLYRELLHIGSTFRNYGL